MKEVDRMSTAILQPQADERLMTTEEFLALPEDGVERELIRGRVKEREMTRRNPMHSSVMITVGQILKNWLDAQPQPRGKVYGGEVGFRIRRDPDTTVGIDVAYVDAAVAARTAKGAKLVDAAPVVAVEILSPSDKQEEIYDKVQDYLDAGTRWVLVIEPVFETITLYRPDQKPVLLSGEDLLQGESVLPGFACAVKNFFD